MNFNIQYIKKEHDVIIQSLNSKESLDIVTSKVENFIKHAKPFSQDTTVEKLIIDLEIKLKAHDCNDLSTKVHEVFYDMQSTSQGTSVEEARSITLLNRALDKYVNEWVSQNDFRNVFSSKGRNALLALKSIQNCENNIEIRCKIIELKIVVERDLSCVLQMPGAAADFFSKVKNVACQIFNHTHWRSSNERVLELLKADPKRFGLTKDQLFETAQIIIEKYPEKIGFLMKDHEVGEIFDWRSQLNFKKTEEVGLRFDRQASLKNYNCKALEERSVQALAQFITQHGLQCLKDHLEENMSLFGENIPLDTARKWLMENVETIGLKKEKRFEILKRLVEKDPEAAMKLLNKYDMGTTCLHIDGDNVFMRFSLITSDEFLEIARVIEGPAIIDLKHYFSSLLRLRVQHFTKSQQWEFMKLAMEKDSTGEISFHVRMEMDFGSKTLPKDEVQKQMLELLAISIIHQPNFMPDQDYSRFFIEDKDEVLKRNPELLLFLEPEKAIERGIPELGYYPLDEMAQEACTKKDPERTSLLKWIGYTGVCRKFYKSPELERRGSEILSKILTLRFPALRYKMTKLLCRELSFPSSRACLESESLKKLFSGKNSSLFQLLLTPVLSEESNVPDLIPIIFLLNSSYYEDVERRKTAASALMALENSSLTKEEKLKTLNIIFPIEAAQKLQEDTLAVAKLSKREKQSNLEALNFRRKELCMTSDKNLQLMEAFINLHWIDKLKETRRLGDLEAIFQNQFISVTGIDQVQEFGEKYLRTFAAARNPLAIFIYASKLRSLPSSNEKIALLEAFKECVESILNGAFPLLRYEGVPGDHLSTVFKGRPELKALWMQGESKKLSEFAPSSKKGSIAEYVRTYLHQRICADGHIQEENFPFLVKGLKDPDKVNEMLVSVDAEIATLKKGSEYNKLLLEKGLLRLLSGSTAEFLSEKDLIAAVFPDAAQFKRDLQDLKTSLSAKKAKKEVLLENYTIADTDSWEDLLLCGTDVPGSCQSIHAEVSTNKCLLGYILDGKNRIIIVKKEDGTQVARAVMRILLDKKTKTPVLFQERIYAGLDLRAGATEALDQMFEERAKALKIPLVRSPPTQTLCSLNGKAPCEYVDEERLGVTNGKWEIGG